MALGLSIWELADVDCRWHSGQFGHETAKLQSANHSLWQASGKATTENLDINGLMWVLHGLMCVIYDLMCVLQFE